VTTRVDPADTAADTAAVTRDGRNEFIAALVLGWLLNVVAWMFDSVEIGRWGSLLLGAAVLGVANAIVKPILVLLTLPLILVTLGLSYFAINVAMLALAEWVAPDFSIDGFWTYVGATIVIWLVNWILSSLLASLLRGSGDAVRTVSP
jgi:putative membrane protein